VIKYIRLVLQQLGQVTIMFRSWLQSLRNAAAEAAAINAQEKAIREWLAQLPGMPQGVPAYENRVRELEEFLKHYNPQKSYGSIRYVAQERAAVEWLCTVRRQLPSAGLDVVAPVLEREGFRFNHEQFGTFTTTYFPEGWVLKPYRDEPSLADSSHAELVDPYGRVRAYVFFRSNDMDYKGRITLAN